MKHLVLVVLMGWSGCKVDNPGFVPPEEAGADATAQDAGVEAAQDGMEQDVTCYPWYPDKDKDGAGDPSGKILYRCGQEIPPFGYVSTPDDCDDTDPNIGPTGTWHKVMHWRWRWDWNCNGKDEQRWPDSKDWLAPVPPCGAPAPRSPDGSHRYQECK